jgi:predicted metal-dependent hydrolase
MRTVRFPKFDFQQCPAHWSGHPEYAQHRNAASATPSMIEPYLIKVLHKAKTHLGAADEQLIKDIDWFIGQESQHYRQHMQFNRRLVQCGYERIPEFEKELENDYKEFLSNRSLRFNIAYSEGFESLGATSGQVIFKYFDNLHRSIDPDAAHLWKWHLAEEFEHRCVMYDVYKRLYGKGITRGYFGRVYGFLYAFFHLTPFVSKVQRYLLEEDRKHMSPAEIAASKRRERQVGRKMALATLPRLLLVLLPWYNPLHKKPPAGLMEYLAEFEKGGRRARSGSSAST